jgi:hypothetical protein
MRSTRAGTADGVHLPDGGKLSHIVLEGAQEGGYVLAWVIHTGSTLKCLTLGSGREGAATTSRTLVRGTESVMGLFVSAGGAT